MSDEKTKNETDAQAVRSGAVASSTAWAQRLVRDQGVNCGGVSDEIHGLRCFLDDAVTYDTAYEARYGEVLYAVALAHRLGLKAGFRIDPREPRWPVAFIELPSGQVSWHMPRHETAWDGHSTEDKFERIAAFGEGVDALWR